MTRQSQKGFSYYLEDEKLIAYSKLSAKEKLLWLEEINKFIRLTETKASAKARKLFEDKSFKNSGYPNE